MEKNYKSGFYKHKGKKRTSKKQRSRQKQLRKIIICTLLAAAVVIIATIVVVKKIEKDNWGIPVKAAEALDDTIYFDAPAGMKDKLDENLYRYVKRAYSIFGTWPDAELIKISDKVARNDFNWESDFYVGEGQLYKNYFVDGQAKGRIGIDVSQYQGEIDWKAVKDAGIEVAIVRLGYRGYGESASLNLDDTFATNVAGSTEQGIETGVYFYSQAISVEEGVEEANYVLENIKGMDIKGPVVIDTEYMYDTEARANEIDKEVRTDAVAAFCETIKNAGYTPMVYASHDWFFRDLNVEKIGQYDFWLAAYDTPDFPYHVEAYQYTPEGYVAGIPAAQVDLNVFMNKSK